MDLDSIEIGMGSALLVVDMQNDFLPGGALPVAHGDEIILSIAGFVNKFADAGGYVVFTQDWHPAGHHSFASAHPGAKPGDPIDPQQYPGLGPILWPDHCVQNTHGAKIHPDMPVHRAVAIIRKGYHQTIDSYSAFAENDHRTKTGLAGFLREIGVLKVFICGLALDYCCYYSAVDARKAGFEVNFLQDLSKGIGQPAGNIESTLDNMRARGINIL